MTITRERQSHRPGWEAGGSRDPRAGECPTRGYGILIENMQEEAV